MTTRGAGEGAMVDTGAVLASLYDGPLSGFIARRREAVAQLKAGGHKEVAARIATAAKPSRAAHLANQVFRHARAVYDEVLDAGTAARAAQQARLLGQDDADVPRMLRARDEAVRAAVQEALRLADAEGLGAGETLASPVRASFEGLAAHGLDSRLPHGVLVEDVPLPGWQAMAGLVLPAEVAPSRRFEIVARHDPSEAPAPSAPDPRRAEADARLADARERAQLAATRVDELERALDATRGVLADAEREVEAARERLAAAARAVEAGQLAREGAVREAERRRQAVVDAERAVAALDTPSPPPRGPRATR